MFVFEAFGLACIGTCQELTLGLVPDYTGSVFLHLEQQGVVSIYEIEVENGVAVVVPAIFSEAGGEFTFWFKDENGDRMVYTTGMVDYDGFSVKVLGRYRTVAVGACEGCDPAPFVLTTEDINFLQRTLQWHPNDEAALAAGLVTGDWYILSQDSDIGVWGTPKVIVL